MTEKCRKENFDKDLIKEDGSLDGLPRRLF
jgi:hypothetical protein